MMSPPTLYPYCLYVSGIKLNGLVVQWLHDNSDVSTYPLSLLPVCLWYQTEWSDGTMAAG